VSITTYEELQTAIGRWSKRANLSDLFADFIRLGEVRIGRDLRIRAMETTLESTIASGVIAVPTGYAELKFAYVDGTPIRPLERKDAEAVLSRYPTRSAEGQPRLIARQGSSFIFGPYPDTTYTIKGIYYKRFDALSDQNPAGWLVVNAPDLILSAALAELFMYAEDDANTQKYLSRYQTSVDEIQSEDRREEFSGSPLTVSAR
jgi:hypothetical protein